MRIGTWNMQGSRAAEPHTALMAEAACDVWLLTEVHPDTDLGDPAHHVRSLTMAGTKDRSWAAITARAQVTPVSSPHPATAVALVDGITFCSSVLPWRSASSTWPDGGDNVAQRTRGALDRLAPLLTGGDGPVVWGGDWNHALSGREYAGSIAGRAHIQETLTSAGLTVPTEALPHRLPDLLSIDHIAVPTTWRLGSAERIVAERPDGRRLSDHDVYVVEAWPH